MFTKHARAATVHLKAHRDSQAKELLLQQEVVNRPWAKVAADLCEVDNSTLLVISDYNSNFIAVARPKTMTSGNVIKEIKAVFAPYGIPRRARHRQQLPVCFRRIFCFRDTISSHYHPQANGKAENPVKTVKKLFRESGQSEFLALLDWRNTPTEGFGTSPAQRLMGRRCKTLVPVAGTLLQPRYSTETLALIGSKQRKKQHCNHHVKPLQPIDQGESVRMKLPGQKTRSPGTWFERLAREATK